MSGAPLALGGWMAALLAAAAAVLAARLLQAQREAAVRAAHELRGPLTAIGLGLELSRRQGAPESFRALELELARARLALEDLGSGGYVRGGLARLERIELEGLIADCVAGAQGVAAAAGVRLREPWWSGPRAFVWGDRLRLAQALANLIANAIEHGGGEVTVCGRAVEARARIEVIDGGPGLTAPVAALAAGAAWPRARDRLRDRARAQWAAGLSAGGRRGLSGARAAGGQGALPRVVSHSLPRT